MTASPLATVLDAFTEVMGEPAPQGADTMPDDVAMWTSVTHVHLIYEIESRLGVTLPGNFLIYSGSLGDLAEAIKICVPRPSASSATDAADAPGPLHPRLPT